MPDGPADGGGHQGIVRIAVDLLGGDDAPAVVVDGALRAIGADPDLHLLLVGPSDVADKVVGLLPAADRPRVSVRVVSRGVRMTESPVRAVGMDTTVRAAVMAVAEGSAHAVVSAGASGATVTAAVLGLGRLPGIRRPALAAVLPAVAGPVVLLDVGASVEASASTLTGHAVLGAGYAMVDNGVAAPRVGLVSIGVERGKGDRARRAADAALVGWALPGQARYVGMVEGHDVSLGGLADVAVTDGFTGNVLLKGIEGAYAMAGGEASDSIAPRAAALLGVRGPVVVCHGAARPGDVASGIGLAVRLHRRSTIDRLHALLVDLTEVAT